MDAKAFSEFLKSADSLRIFDEGKLIFSSTSDRLLPLLEFMDRYGFNHKELTVFDKIIGNAAALLSVKAGCTEACSPLGSEAGVATLKRFSVKYHFDETVPLIRQPNGDICPMEKMSAGKEPEEFYLIMKKLVGK